MLTLGDTGKWFSDTYKMTPPAAITSLEDWKGEGCQTTWYNCKNYKVNIFNDRGYLALRDIQIFSENYADRYLEDYTSEHWTIYDALPVIDGYRWGTDNKKSYLIVLFVLAIIHLIFGNGKGGSYLNNPSVSNTKVFMEQYYPIFPAPTYILPENHEQYGVEKWK